MTDEERKKLINEIGDAIESFPIDDTENVSIAVLAIAERRIREDCAEIVNTHKPKRDTPAHNLVAHCLSLVSVAILASIPKEPK